MNFEAAKAPPPTMLQKSGVRMPFDSPVPFRCPPGNAAPLQQYYLGPICVHDALQDVQLRLDGVDLEQVDLQAVPAKTLKFKDGAMCTHAAAGNLLLTRTSHDLYAMSCPVAGTGRLTTCQLSIPTCPSPRQRQQPKHPFPMLSDCCQRKGQHHINDGPRSPSLAPSTWPNPYPCASTFAPPLVPLTPRPSSLPATAAPPHLAQPLLLCQHVRQRGQPHLHLARARPPQVALNHSPQLLPLMRPGQGAPASVSAKAAIGASSARLGDLLGTASYHTEHRFQVRLMLGALFYFFTSVNTLLSHAGALQRQRCA